MSKGRKAPEAHRSAEDYRKLALAMHEAEPAAGLTVADMQAACTALAQHLGMSTEEINAQIKRLVEGPQTPQEHLLVRLNARYAGNIIVPARRPRR